MKRYVVFLFILSSMFTLNAQNPLWEKVQDYEKESLPKSALEEVEKIQQEAIKNNNSPEIIKTWIYKLKYETAINYDRLPEIITELENYNSVNKNEVEKAFIHYVLAKVYSDYYTRSRYLINQRTQVAGYVPEDIREWSSNNFIDRIAEHVRLSIQPAKELQKTTILDYKTVLEEGKSSRELRPTAYDFLANQGIELLKQIQYAQDLSEEIKKMYQSLIDFRKKEANEIALLVVQLDALEYDNNQSQSSDRDEVYLKNLDDLKSKFSGKEFAVEILFKEANFYLNNQYKYEEEERKQYTQKAYQICQEGIQKYPKYDRIPILKNLLAQITHSSLEVNAQNVVYPGEDLRLKISSKNVNKVSIAIYKINAPVSNYLNEWSRNGLYKEHGKLVENKEINLPNKFPYLSEDTTIQIPMKDLGCYEYVISTDGIEPANFQFSVSRLAAISRGLGTGREYLVVDRMTGEPLEGAQIHFYERLSNSNKKSDITLKTNKLGLASGSGDRNLSSFNATFGNDTALILASTPWVSTRNNNRNDENTILSLFTDRSIYRPGQTVFFKGILYLSDPKKQEIIPNKKCKITLLDANSKEIITKEFRTNEFGSISGEFTIPQGILNGYFSLRSDEGNAYTNFRVEEYKRPTFDITFKENDKTYNFGDKLTVEGEVKSFSGINLQNTKVSYQINRSIWPYFGARSYAQIGDGDVYTNEDGSFSISFMSEKLLQDNDKKYIVYLYTINATVTDSNGETQTSSKSIFVSNKSMYLSFVGLDNLNKENLDSFKIQATNSSQVPVSAKGTYEIYRLKAEKELMKMIDTKDWKTDKLIHSGSFESGKEIALKFLAKQASGAYRIIAKSKDDQGRDVEEQKDIILSSAKDARPPIPVYEWVLTPKTKCEVGEKAEIIYGTSEKKVYVLYELFKDNQKLSESRFELNNENRKIEIPFLESYGDGITANFTFIKDENIYTESVNIYRKQPDKNLSLKMEVFRDRLLPGQTEEWKISVKNASENPAFAELLAGMYDASLDKINQHAWSFNPIRSIYLNSPSFHSNNMFGKSTQHQTVDRNYYDVSTYKFDSFNWFGWNIYNQMLRGSGGGMRIRGTSSMDLGANKKEVLEEVPSVQMYSDAVEISDIDNALQGTVAGLNAPEQENLAQIRQNFNETAFFYPQLKTNEAGETLISFTLPESNTTWKFMALAHTKDLHFGQLTKEVISQKRLMITPNIPRFVREGDKMSISSNISNLSENPVSGNITIEFFDPNTNKITIVVPEKSKAFSLEPGKTTAVTWNFGVPSGIDMTAVKIVATTNEFSDGEQHLISVLPNRMLVTESMHLNVLGGESKSFTFDKLAKPNSSTLENYRLTLEFASNPTWYAVQALPTMTNPQNEDVLSWFAAFYSNTLASYIANSTPKIKEMINVWTKQGENAETLFSNLEKNQELKAILLEETPWVLQAENETEQKQRLALLFDLNRISYQNSQALDKLKALQTTEGGWSWFKGMYANVSITQWILYGMGELESMKAAKFNNETQEMQMKAIEFIDQKFYNHFEALKKYDKKWKESKSISTYEIEYLLVRSLYPNIPIEKTKEASDFYMNILKKYWSKNANLYNRAISATVLKRNGETQIAKTILKSLREHASKKSDLGMFWANNNTYSFMFQSATANHTFIMDAFQELGATPAEMDQMKLWLLKQKQVQDWESVPATVNAINILLKTGSNWLESEGKTSISLGKKQIDTTKGEAGTGYIKESFDSNSFTSEMATVTVSKENEGPAWGALYWQYFEDLDKITSAKTELNVEKKLFVEKVISGGKELVAIDKNSPIKVGDKVTVRLTVRTDRDMEYVMLKDMRASCFEPVNQKSGMQWSQRVMYYLNPKDASMNFYFYNLPKGTYVFEYSLYATSPGDYSNGITTIQCMYAPEFMSHTSGGRVNVIVKL